MVYEEVEASRMAGSFKENTKILMELATGKSSSVQLVRTKTPHMTFG